MIDLVGDIGWVDLALRVVGVDETITNMRAAVAATADDTIRELVQVVSGPSPVWWTRGLVGIPLK